MERVSCKEVTQYCSIPEPLLEEILIRLPEKSIFKFKSVSKEWLSLISDPYFARSHISHRKSLENKASSSSQIWTILGRSTYNSVSVFRECPPERSQLKRIASPDFASPGFSILSCPDDPKSLYKILSVCSISGLLLLSGFSKIHTSSLYHLCNPITGRWVTLPPPKGLMAFLQIQLDLVTQVDDKGCVTSYKVVIVKQTREPTEVLDMHMFSSETNEWMSIKVHCSQPVKLNGRQAILLNGILHYPTDQRVILAYDPYGGSDNFRLINCPTLKEFEKEFCCVSQGRLLYFAQDSNHPSIRIWVLKDYDQAKWRMECKVKLPSDIDKSYWPVTVHPFNSSIVYMWHPNCISSFDVRTRELEVCCDNICVRRLCYKTAVSYVFPPWPMSFPQLSADAIVHS